MRAADVEGRGGRGAWIVPIPDDGPPDWKATLAGWFVHAPGAHPAWSWWYVGVIHLRDIPGVRPAIIRRPGATHEVMFMALDPKAGSPVDRDLGRDGLPFLEPIDLEHQLVDLTDDHARGVAISAVRAIVALGWSPDQDFRSMWATALDATADHHRAGAHEAM